LRCRQLHANKVAGCGRGAVESPSFWVEDEPHLLTIAVDEATLGQSWVTLDLDARLEAVSANVIQVNCLIRTSQAIRRLDDWLSTNGAS